MCQSPRHARAYRGHDIIDDHRHHCVHRRRRGAYLRLATRTDSRNYVYSFGNPYSGTCSVLVLSGWIPNNVRVHAVVNLRWEEGAPDIMTPHLFRKHVHLQFQCFGKLLGGRRIIGTDVAELSGRQVPTSMLRSHG